MKKELVSFTIFKKYAEFLLNNHLDELVKVDLARARKLNVPLLKLFSHLSEEEMFQVSKKGLQDYLQTIVDEKALEVVDKSMKDWIQDKLPGIPRDKVVASDIALIYNARKYSLLSFIPLFTDDLHNAIDLMKEIEDYYTYQESKSIQTFAQINKDEIQIRENRLKEAQKLARLGYWEYDIEKDSVIWSEELYAIYGMNPSQGLSSEKIIKHIFAEDVPMYNEKIKELYNNPGSTFTYDYRILNEAGETRHLSDKAYTEYSPQGKLLIKGITQDISEKKEAVEEQNKLKSMVDASGDFIGLADMNGRSIYINEAGRELVGLGTQEDVQKTKMVDYFPSDIQDHINANIIPEVLSNGHWEGELQFQHFNTKELIDVTWNVFLVKDSSGNAIGIGCISQDIRPRKKYEALIKSKQSQLEESQEIAHLGSWEWDITENIVSWSDEMYRLFGYEPGEITMNYELYLSHIHPSDRELVSSSVTRCFKEQIPYTFENRIIRKDGTIRWLFAKGKVSQSDGVKSMKLSGIAMDITTDKKREISLKQRTVALEASNKELEAFCYTISHDLRSPLRAIDGFGRRLANNYAAILGPEGQRLLNVVRTNAQQMGVLIDSLLEFSRLNRRELQKAPLDMKEIVSKVIEEYNQQYPHHRAKFEFKDFGTGIGDKELIRQVWHNLIANAVKFSSKTEKPMVEIGSEKKGEDLIFFIKDNGAGFEMAYIDKLFGVFQRLHSEDEFAGTGIGLASIQRIIHRHGGKVWAHGEPGKGAVFYFTLPEVHEVKDKSLYLEKSN